MFARSALWYTSLASLLLAYACIGCQPPTEQAGAGGKQEGTLRIAVIPKGTTHEFWKSVHFGAQQAADELGDVEIYWKGPLMENDRAGQINVVQNFITMGVDGLCLAPLDSQALIDPVRGAKKAGIPTVIFDSGLDDEQAIVSYVATDNYRGGELAAERLGEVLGGKGGVILLRYNPGSESTHQREEGFLSTLREKYPDIEILSSDQYSGTTPQSSLAKAQALLIRYADQVDGMFAVCEPNGTGILAALEDAGLAGKVKFVSFDPSPGLIEAMREGKVHGIVLQDPATMGYEGVKAIVSHLRGQPVEKRVPTGEYVATPENMDDEQMQKLLSPPQYGE